MKLKSHIAGYYRTKKQFGAVFKMLQKKAEFPRLNFLTAEIFSFELPVDNVLVGWLIVGWLSVFKPASVNHKS